MNKKDAYFNRELRQLDGICTLQRGVVGTPTNAGSVGTGDCIEPGVSVNNMANVGETVIGPIQIAATSNDYRGYGVTDICGSTGNLRGCFRDRGYEQTIY